MNCKSAIEEIFIKGCGNVESVVVKEKNYININEKYIEKDKQLRKLLKSNNEGLQLYEEISGLIEALNYYEGVAFYKEGLKFGFNLGVELTDREKQ